MKRNTKLRNELKRAGALDVEVNELVELGESIKQLKEANSVPKLRWQAKSRLIVPAGLALVAGLELGIMIVIASQATLPGNMLYPIQKLSDSVAVSVDPSYRATIMMKRAQEVKQLVANHANSNLVFATLDDYMSEALVYKSVSANYAAFEDCKDNLQQAAKMATGPEYQAIENSLSSLNDV